jgi:hypothetical protein
VELDSRRTTVARGVWGVFQAIDFLGLIAWDSGVDAQALDLVIAGSMAVALPAMCVYFALRRRERRRQTDQTSRPRAYFYAICSTFVTPAPGVRRGVRARMMATKGPAPAADNRPDAGASRV